MTIYQYCEIMTSPVLSLGTLILFDDRRDHSSHCISRSKNHFKLSRHLVLHEVAYVVPILWTENRNTATCQCTYVYHIIFKSLFPPRMHTNVSFLPLQPSFVQPSVLRGWLAGICAEQTAAPAAAVPRPSRVCNSTFIRLLLFRSEKTVSETLAEIFITNLCSCV